MATYEVKTKIDKKYHLIEKISYVKVERQCFQYIFVHYYFFNVLVIRVVGAVGDL